MKIIFSYLMIFAFIILFSLFLDATSGFFVLIIFIGAIVLSSVLHIIAVRSFDCDIAVNTSLVERGEEIGLSVRVSRAAFFLPSVFTVKLRLSYHFECDESTYTVTLGRAEKERVFTLKSVFWGKGSIGIGEVKCIDILGIFTFFKLSGFNRVINKNLCVVKVFPCVPLLSERSELVRVLEEASAYDDNENSREVSVSLVGFPGYEHRDYVPGDSLKSINWKLSAKRDKLLVRKLEAYAGGDQVFVLDSRLSPNDQPDGYGAKDEAADKSFIAREQEQTVIEAMLALVKVMTKQELVCRVFVRMRAGWELFAIDGTDGLEGLRYALTDYLFSDVKDRLPDISTQNASGFVVFTSNADGGLLSAVEELKQKGINPEVASSVIGMNDWRIEKTDGEVVFSRN